MKRLLSFAYGLFAYTAALAALLYLIAFVGDFLVPRTANSESPGAWTTAIPVNLGLLLLFGIQHSVMARQSFKRWIDGVVPQKIERSTYVLVSAAVLAMLLAFWQPVGGELWRVSNPLATGAIYTVFGLGWLLALVSTFLTDHFDFFGLRQVYLHLIDEPYTDVGFTERLFYKKIRHPMMLGMLIGFWAVPIMTATHLMLSIGLTVYIFVGIYFEERALSREIGAEYTSYVQRTGRVLPPLFG